MKKDIKKLIEALRQNNLERNIKINDSDTDEVEKSYQIGSYNTTIDFIRKLERLLQ
jgi:hypothetical protein